jgi:uncharacterized protein with ParB-like and HNH nuclease domain
MKTDTITIFGLFEKQRRYLVPIFQRGYVWTLENQWQPLWENILEQRDLLREQKADDGLVRSHFLGAIVLNQVAVMSTQVACSEIIDGQQRLITLQVFLAALRDAITGLNSAHLNHQLHLLTDNAAQEVEPEENYKVWPTNAYQSDFENVMLCKDLALLNSKYPRHWHYRKLVPPLPPIVDAYFFFHKCISNYLSSDEDGQILPETSDDALVKLKRERASLLYDAVVRHIQLVLIELEKEDDPQVIFETLNYRGVPLEPCDLIRNFLFLSALRLRIDVDALYKKWWLDFDIASGSSGKFWKEKERQGRLFRSRLDLLFFHYLGSQTAKVIKMNHVYQEFCDWWIASPRDMETEMKNIKDASVCFQSLIIPAATSRFSIFAERLKILDTTTLYPLILWLYARKDIIGAQEFDNILVDLESYVVRRAVCGMTTKNYNRIFQGILARLQKESSVTRQVVRTILSSFSKDSDVWPADDIFTESILLTPLYTSIGPQKTRMILAALDRSLITGKQEGVIGAYSSLTVEHVLPRETTESVYPYPSTDLGSQPWSHQRLTCIHSLGNLTLLTQSLNSSVSNGPFAIKRGEIAKQSQLRLNSYFQSLSDDSQWDELAIWDRGQELANRAAVLWPGPTPVV